MATTIWQTSIGSLLNSEISLPWGHAFARDEGRLPGLRRNLIVTMNGMGMKLEMSPVVVGGAGKRPRRQAPGKRLAYVSALNSILMRTKAPTAPTTKDFTTCSFLHRV